MQMLLSNKYQLRNQRYFLLQVFILEKFHTHQNLFYSSKRKEWKILLIQLQIKCYPVFNLSQFLFSKVFFIYELPMKNPFLNTDHYAIVRQYQRISSKQRSVSNLQASLQSSRCSYSPMFTSTVTSSSSIRQSRISSSNKYESNLDQKMLQKLHIQNMRVKVFGVQQLRYRPSYYDEISKKMTTKNNKKYKKLSNKYDKESDCSLEQESLQSNETGKDVEKLKCANSSLKFISKQPQQIQIFEDYIKENQLSHSKYTKHNKKVTKQRAISGKENIQTQRFSNSYSIKEDQLLSSFIRDKQPNKNVNYNSMAEFQSRQSLHEIAPKKLRSAKKKCSVFQAIKRNSDSQSQNDYYELKKISKRRSEVERGQTQKSLKSILKIPISPTPRTNGNTRFSYSLQTQELFPPLINVRDKIYYLKNK